MTQQLLMTKMVAVEAEVEGVEMGVLADGTAYLTQRGLAKICGVAPSTIIEQFQQWAQGKRTSALARSILLAGYQGDRLSAELKSNKHAVPDNVCILVLGHYALEKDNDTAKRSLYVLAREGLSKFIYRATGYNPAVVLPRGLRDFHDRLLLSTMPVGFFSVFREMAEFLLRAVQAGLAIDEGTVPDISVGKLWSTWWSEAALDAQFGVRQRWEHNYPDHYPQAASNPQEIWVYPVAALGAFRGWLDAIYIPSAFPRYLDGKVKKNVLDREDAARLIAAVTPTQLPPAP